MNPLTQSNRLFAPLFSDVEISSAFGTQRTFDHFLAFEIGLTTGLGASGVVAVELAQAAISRMYGFAPDLAAIEAAVQVDGLPAPEYVRQLKCHIGPDLTPAVHVGGTSQDLIDTATVLTLKDVNVVLAARLDNLVAAVERLMIAHGSKSIMGRTRMQAAWPISVAHRLNSWLTPLKHHRHTLDLLRPNLEVLQFGGATGDRRTNKEQSEMIGAVMAEKLGLTDPGHAWHNDRTRFADYAGWLSIVTGSLGKIGQDICLMAQQGIGEVEQSGGGSSSAMAHKQNPVGAELLVTLATFNAGQVSLMHNALVHEQERSGAAWTLEWMVLPAIVCSTGKALAVASEQLQAITRIGA